MLTAAINNYDTAGAKLGMEGLNSSLMTLSNAFYEAKTKQNGAGAAHVEPPYTPPSADDSVAIGTSAGVYVPEDVPLVNLDHATHADGDDSAADTNFRDV